MITGTAHDYGWDQVEKDWNYKMEAYQFLLNNNFKHMMMTMYSETLVCQSQMYHFPDPLFNFCGP
jgi:hypothetical protein